MTDLTPAARIEVLEKALRKIIALFDYEYPIPLQAPSIAREALGVSDESSDHD